MKNTIITIAILFLNFSALSKEIPQSLIGKATKEIAEAHDYLIRTKYEACNKKINIDTIAIYMASIMATSPTPLKEMLKVMERSCEYIKDNAIKYHSMQDIVRAFLKHSEENVDNFSFMYNSFKENLTKTVRVKYTWQDVNNLAYQSILEMKYKEKQR